MQKRRTEDQWLFKVFFGLNYCQTLHFCQKKGIFPIEFLFCILDNFYAIWVGFLAALSSSRSLVFGLLVCPKTL